MVKRMCYMVVDSNANRLILRELERRGKVRIMGEDYGFIVFYGEPEYDDVYLAVRDAFPTFGEWKVRDYAVAFMTYRLNPCR